LGRAVEKAKEIVRDGGRDGDWDVLVMKAQHLAAALQRILAFL
jgi:hypothetical protein